MTADEPNVMPPDPASEEQSAESSRTEAATDRQHHDHAFRIKTPVFEGPLDLLLNLIEKRKLFISDISLSSVTDEYISHINQLPEYSLKHRTQFILIASTLLLIKAKSLLPSLELTEEEQGDIQDLERRLKILNLIRKKSVEIRELYGKKRIYPRGDMDETVIVFAPGKDISPETAKESLKDAIYRVLNSLPKTVVEPKATVKKVISLEEMMERLEDRINNAMKMTFSQFSRGKDGGGSRGQMDKMEKVNVILSFLAMLELVKQGAIDVRQDRTFEEIEMERMEIGVPEYAEPVIVEHVEDETL